MALRDVGMFESKEVLRPWNGVTFDEATQTLRDEMAIDLDDLKEPDNVVTLAASPGGLPCVL